MNRTRENLKVDVQKVELIKETYKITMVLLMKTNSYEGPSPCIDTPDYIEGEMEEVK